MSPAPSHRIDLPPWSLWETRMGTGTPVVLIHGLSGSSNWWRRNIGEISKSHDVAAVDLVGFGRNRTFLPGPFPPTFDDSVALLARWIGTTFTEPVHLVGHSMGGHLAIHLAATYPEIVRSLVLVGSTGVPFQMKPVSHLRHMPYPPREAISFSPVLAWDFMRAGPSSVALATARLFRDDARDAMNRVGVPSLLVWGEHDPFVPETYAERIRQHIAGSSLIVIPRASHVPMWENASAFNSAVLDFFEEVDRSRIDTPDVRPGFGWGIAGIEDGIACRRAGRRPSVVLIHGLGASSAYFRPLASAIHAAGLDVIAPDLPGFGFSTDAPPRGPEEQAATLVKWAGGESLQEAVWIGHSTGCHIVDHVRRQAGELVRSAVFLSPVWNDRNLSGPYLAGALVRDVFREPLGLVPPVARDYWRTGVYRWFATLLRELRESKQRPHLEHDDLLISGADDPLTHWDHLERLAPGRTRRIPGAHAINYSNPAAIVSAAWERMNER